MATRVWVRWSKTRTRSVSMNAAIGTPTGSRVGQRHARLEDRDRVVGERTDRAAGETGHALRSAATRRRGHERPERRERVGDARLSIGQVGIVVPDADRPGLDPGDAVARPRAGAADRRPGTSSARGARRPRRTRAGMPGRRRRGGGMRRSGSRDRPSRVARRRIVSALPDEAFRLAEAERVGACIVVSSGRRSRLA